jgi:hypothetical protein
MTVIGSAPAQSPSPEEQTVATKFEEAVFSQSSRYTPEQRSQFFDEFKGLYDKCPIDIDRFYSINDPSKTLGTCFEDILSQDAIPPNALKVAHVVQDKRTDKESTTEGLTRHLRRITFYQINNNKQEGINAFTGWYRSHPIDANACFVDMQDPFGSTIVSLATTIKYIARHNSRHELAQLVAPSSEGEVNAFKAALESDSDCEKYCARISACPDDRYKRNPIIDFSTPGLKNGTSYILEALENPENRRRALKMGAVTFYTDTHDNNKEHVDQFLQEKLKENPKDHSLYTDVKTWITSTEEFASKKAEFESYITLWLSTDCESFFNDAVKLFSEHPFKQDGNELKQDLQNCILAPEGPGGPTKQQKEHTCKKILRIAHLVLPDKNQKEDFFKSLFESVEAHPNNALAVSNLQFWIENNALDFASLAYDGRQTYADKVKSMKNPTLEKVFAPSSWFTPKKVFLGLLLGAGALYYYWKTHQNSSDKKDGNEDNARGAASVEVR